MLKYKSTKEKNCIRIVKKKQRNPYNRTLIIKYDRNCCN